MAKQVITSLIDDLDGSEADETVRFALDGIEFEIDLNQKNAAKLRDFMSAYQEAGTRLGRVGAGAQLRSHRNPVVSDRNTREVNQKIREWAGQNGYELAERGRIPEVIVEAYRAGRPHPDKVKADALANTKDAVGSLNSETVHSTSTPRKRAAKKGPGSELQQVARI